MGKKMVWLMRLWIGSLRGAAHWGWGVPLRVTCASPEGSSLGCRSRQSGCTWPPGPPPRCACWKSKQRCRQSRDVVLPSLGWFLCPGGMS